MRKFFTNIILIVFFAFVIGAVLLQALAEAGFKSAKRAEALYRWNQADVKYNLATKTTFYNTEYLSGYGDFLLNVFPYSEDKIAKLEKAIKLYERAVELNSRCAIYYAKLAQAELRMALQLSGKNRLSSVFLKRAFLDFKQAIRQDPNGIYIAYLIAYEGISAWGFINDDEKELVLDRFKYALSYHPWLLEQAYARVWQYTKDPYLTQSVTPKNLLRSGIDEKTVVIRTAELNESLVSDTILKEDWRGRSRDRRNVYKNGLMYWSGTMKGLLKLPSGKATIEVEAEGTSLNGVYPYMIVRLNGEKIGETFIKDRGKYSFDIMGDGQIKVLSIIFVNDNYSETEDRNLYIDTARVIKNRSI